MNHKKNSLKKRASPKTKKRVSSKTKKRASYKMKGSGDLEDEIIDIKEDIKNIYDNFNAIRKSLSDTDKKITKMIYNLTKKLNLSDEDYNSLISGLN
jgi:flavoprotein